MHICHDAFPCVQGLIAVNFLAIICLFFLY